VQKRLNRGANKFFTVIYGHTYSYKSYLFNHRTLLKIFSNKLNYITTKMTFRELFVTLCIINNYQY
jgi:hypothetical protein